MSWSERYTSKMNRSSWKTAHEDYHPEIEDWQDLDAHLMSHHSGDFIGDIDDHEWFHLAPDDYHDFHHENNFPIEDNQPDHYHTNDYEGINVPSRLPKSFASFNKLSDPTDQLRGEGVSSFTEPGYQDDQDPDEQVVGPQDLDSNATNVDKFPKSVGVFKNSSSSWNNIKTADDAGGSQFGTQVDYNENRMQSLTDTSRLQSRFPIDDGQRNYSEQRQDANPLTLRSWFTGDDVNGPWPHTKNLSGPLDFEPTDNQNEDSTGPVMGSFQERYSHMEGINHPWPKTFGELAKHYDSHHPDDVKFNAQYWNMPPEKVIRGISAGAAKNAFEAHSKTHKNPTEGLPKPDHEHDDDLNVDVPDNMETIEPAYITSSWHQSTVEVFDTHPDEESPDTLLNPSDELKNGRPRANDLPNQSAQLLPGMLIDHDQMGGSGTASGSF